MHGSAPEITDRTRQTRGHLSNSPCYASCLEFLDVLITSAIVGPSVIAYWRGTWNLCEDYLIPDNNVYSAATSFGIGVLGNLFFTFFQGFFSGNFKPDKYRLTFYVVSRLYTYIFGAVCVNGWRGPWALTDIFTGFNLFVVVSLTSLAIVLLTVIKGLRNLSAAPFVIVTDGHVDYFQVTTMFKTSVSWIIECSLYFHNIYECYRV